MAVFIAGDVNSTGNLDAFIKKTEKSCPLAYSYLTSGEVGGYYYAVFSCDTIFAKDTEQIFCKEDASGVEHLTVFQGFCWWRVGANAGQVLNARQLNDLFVQHNGNAREIQNSLLGEYSILHINKSGDLHVFGDQLGIEHLSYFKKNTGFIVSNREGMIEGVLDDPRFDYQSMIQMSIFGRRLSGKGFIEGVAKLDSGGVITVSPANGVGIDTAHPIFSDKNRMSFADITDDMEALLDTAIEEVKANITAALSVVDELPLGLTGGKDSRLTLAFFKYFGLINKIKAYTNGVHTHPDVIIAKQVAEIAGVDYEIREPKGISSGGNNNDLLYISTTELLHRMMVQVYRMDAMFGIWDLKARGTVGFGVGFAGFVGEMLKGYLKNPVDFGVEPKLSDFIPLHGTYDPLGLVDQSSKDLVEAEFTDFFSGLIEKGFDNEDMTDLFYASVILPNWFGSAKLSSGYGIQTISLLNSPSLIKLAFNLSAQERSLELVHYHLLNRMCPELTSVPFAMQAWKEGAVKYGLDPDVIKSAIKPERGVVTRSSWQFLINRNPVLRKSIINLLERFPDNKLWEYLDHGKLIKILHEKQLSATEAISLYGFLGVFFRSSKLMIADRIYSPGNSSLNLDVLTRTEELFSDHVMDILNNKSPDSAPDIEINLTRISDRKILGNVFCSEFPRIPVMLELRSDEKLVERLLVNQKSPGRGFDFEFDLPSGEVRHYVIKPSESDVTVQITHSIPKQRAVLTPDVDLHDSFVTRFRSALSRIFTGRA